MRNEVREFLAKVGTTNRNTNGELEMLVERHLRHQNPDKPAESQFIDFATVLRTKQFSEFLKYAARYGWTFRHNEAEDD